ncbi:histidine kinase [Methylobacterium nonmethylotrophicum]|uniref:Histidine kinase n=1 Tax=Methylobacterium nonmethylotrophicum TaxID=1141884 RepID=A0A4Z0NSB8_9HYPH|nr:histidine kinase [Methylobacterium nonmethylotrophicum]TGD99810.1 histidine kinase [Methylobacterium nonmethylotrophicum]
MADYYPLLARALEALPDRSPDLRHTVYERARAALIGQLRSLDPPLSEADIEAERVSLDRAITRLEIEHGGLPEPEPAPPPAPPEPQRQDPPAQRETTRPAEAAGPQTVSSPERPAAEQAPEPPPADTPAPHHADALPEAGPPVELKLPPARPRHPETAEDPAGPESTGPQRPRLEVVAPRRDRSRLIRNGIVAAVLAAVVGAIAVTAWSLRDNPAALPTGFAENGPNRPAENQDSKFADRVGGERAPQAPAPAPAAPQGGAPRPSPTPDIPVAQRGTLYEENGPQGSAPKATQARTVWRLDAVNAGQGQPLQTVVRATVDVPDAGLSLALILRRNTDATLPASHIIELTFTATDPNRTVRDVGLIQFKDDESGRGSPVSGLPVPVRDNLFLIGLSNLKADIERNTDLLLKRNWIDLPVRYANGNRAVLTFEKGNAGEKVMREAFEQWQP